MKPYHRLLCAIAGLLAVSSGWAAEPAAKSDGRAEVTFAHPEKFADVRSYYSENDKDRDAILDQLKEYIVLKSKTYVPEGQKLLVTVTDVDMAGDFEPWRGPAMQDVRVVKDIYPPKIDLEFKLVDAKGAVLKEGKRQLRDLAFQMKISINRDDELRYEKALLDDWLRDDFPRQK
ncbi:MAG TPA: DUF3016 domain-containing protein [Opitutaceae bacterium]|nr:DUF3016 domain-containing protein [Opitutaceae bacterium]HND60653.1 DUF3016 domain-containing protein [Opitutaceae bacterium]